MTKDDMLRKSFLGFVKIHTQALRDARANIVELVGEVLEPGTSGRAARTDVGPSEER